MNAREILPSRLLCKHHVGSMLYGTNLPTSDTDFGGIFMPPDEALIGLSPMEQIDVSEKDKDEAGKNTADATDAVYFSLHKFARLAMQGNPNVLEWLFVPEDKVVVDTPEAKVLRSHFGWFVGMQIVARFIGYATAQKHKMVIRSDKWQSLHAFRDYLSRFEPRQVLIEIKSDPNHVVFCYFKGDDCVVGDMNIQRTALVKKAVEILTERIDKGTSRQDTILQHGFDCYSDDTEFLTMRGWLKYNEILSKDQLATINPDTLVLEFQKPSARIKKHYKGVLVENENLYTKFRVTPKHRLFVSDTHRSRDNNFSLVYREGDANWHFAMAKELLSKRKSNF